MQGFSKSLERDLRSMTAGECFFDPPTLQQYSSDRCWYKILPLAVVHPRDQREVQSIVSYCNDRGIPIIPRGAATGLAGQAIGMGVILDFTRTMNAVLEESEEFVRVQPGVVLGTLNAKFKSRGMFFPIDPASAAECTVGGMIGTNAAGAHGVRYGATKDHVRSLTVVLSNGELVHIEHPQQPDESANPTFTAIVRTLSPRFREKRDLIRSRFPDVRKNSSGYNLKDAVGEETTDFRKLIVGSEGTLVVIVDAVLDLAPIPKYRMGALVYLKSYDQAVDATLLALELEPAAVEILDHTYVSLTRGFSQATDRLILSEALAMLYVEFEGDDVSELQKCIMQLSRAVSLAHPVKFLPLTKPDELDSLWHLREEASRVINSKSRGKASFIEDVAVPLNHLPQYIEGLSSVLKRYRIGFSLYGHAATGNIHCATFVDLKDLEQYKIIDTVASEVCDLAIGLGGTLSGEHGDGFVRTPFLERLYGPDLFELFRTVKKTFDPNNILNPGKIIGDQNATILHDLDIR